MYIKLGNYQFKYDKPKWVNNSLKVYECHIGMSNIDPIVNNFSCFTK